MHYYTPRADMSDIESKLSLLKNRLETAAFLVGKGGAEKEAHSEIIQSLILVSEIEPYLASPKSTNAPSVSESHEAKKVRRRLKLWSGRQSQINAKILNAFLKLRQAGASVITERDIQKELPEESSFETNFTQMKIIAERNHGKIFDQHGEQVTIWEPIAADVREYERIVFGDN
jgi:hypothetical protein